MDTTPRICYKYIYIYILLYIYILCDKNPFCLVCENSGNIVPILVLFLPGSFFLVIPPTNPISFINNLRDSDVWPTAKSECLGLVACFCSSILVVISFPVKFKVGMLSMIIE